MDNQHNGLAKAYTNYFIFSTTCALLGTSAQAEPLAYALRPQTNLISVIDTRKDSVVRDIDGQFTQVRRISVAPDGKRIYIADQGKDFVSVINAETGSQTKIAFPGRRVLSVTTAPDSRNIYVMTDNGASPIFEVVDSVSGKVTSTFSASLANTGACVVLPIASECIA